MSQRVPVRRKALVPDPLRAARSRRAPELGPRLLFFSGGSALRELSRWLKTVTHNSVHLITPFDSGGSSARLRESFKMPSLGDLRSRMIALADETVGGNPEIYRLFSHRLPVRAEPRELVRRLDEMVNGLDPFVSDIPEPLRQLVRMHLRGFAERMPAAMDLRGASVGNLILAGGYLSYDRDIDAATFLLSRLLEVRGVVRLIVDADLHLAAELQDGTLVTGQHALTGKTRPAISAAVRDLYLVDRLDHPGRAETQVGEFVGRTVRGADLVVFPMGSFYSSIVANLLPKGVGAAVRAASGPRIYVPSTGLDPEQYGMSLGDAVETLARFVARDAGADTRTCDVLDAVLLDRRSGEYAMRLDVDRVRRAGVEVVDLELVSERSRPALDPERLGEALLSLA